MRKCKGGGEVAAMENQEAGMRMTRARAAADVKKRKLDDDGEELSYSSSLVELKRRRRVVVKSQNPTSLPDPENSDVPCASSSSCDHALAASCCSSNVSSELPKGNLTTTDLQEVTSSVEIATSATYDLEHSERRGAPPSRELLAESVVVESATTPPSEANLSPRRSTSVKMPSDAELEEFFSAAEKDIQKQFAKKYNFDIVKEEPLEGRYEWVQVKP